MRKLEKLELMGDFQYDKKNINKRNLIKVHK
jgi:hypothetical protein